MDEARSDGSRRGRVLRPLPPLLASSLPPSLLPLSAGCYRDLTRRESGGIWPYRGPSISHRPSALPPIRHADGRGAATE